MPDGFAHLATRVALAGFAFVGDPAKYTPVGGLPREIRAVIQRAGEAGKDGDPAVNETAVRLLLPAKDVCAPKRGDLVTVAGECFRIESVLAHDPDVVEVEVVDEARA